MRVHRVMHKSLFIGDKSIAGNIGLTLLKRCTNWEDESTVT